MEIGIIGLPGSGKTTLLNALTRAHAQTGPASRTAKPNLGVIKVPDPRLDTLTTLFHSAKTVQAEVSFIDIPGQPPELGKSQGFQGEYLLQVSQSDALLLVLRAFRSPALPDPDPVRELETMETEMAFADMGVIERRLQRIEASNKSAKSQEREALAREAALLGELKTALESGKPLREVDLSPEARKLLSGFTFLTTKPLILVFNIGEEDLPRLEELTKEWQTRYGDRCLALCAKLEEELAQLDAGEAATFRASLGASEDATGALVRMAQRVAGLITFLTTGPDESRAWTVLAGSTAPKAAGRIHSDLERGFIRAEVISYDDLVAAGSYPEARKRGTLRQEGKTYVVQEGDVVNILFSVSAAR